MLGNTKRGYYDVTVKNDTSMRIGMAMDGLDVACSPYVRFTNFMKPGESESFRWVFPPGKVSLREYTCARRSGRTFVDLRFGPHSNSMEFD